MQVFPERTSFGMQTHPNQANFATQAFPPEAFNMGVQANYQPEGINAST